MKICLSNIAVFTLMLMSSGMSLPVMTHANEPAKSITKNDVHTYIHSLYGLFNWPSKGALNKQVFEKAVTGYINLNNAGKITPGKEILTVVDFSQSSNTYRLWIMDMKKKKILFNNYVAHGQGSGDEYATAFSNIENSHQSSLGFYLTRGSYMGENGYSMKLEGVDGKFNNKAMERAIVMHGADYVCKSFIASNSRLGRSWGCPAVSSALAAPIINAIKGGSVLFIYHPSKTYQTQSVWLNKEVKRLPADRFEVEMLAKMKGNAEDKSFALMVEEPADNTLLITDSTVMDTVGTSVIIRNYERKLPIKISEARQ